MKKSKKREGAGDKRAPRIIYYSDELNDEFSTALIEPRVIDKNYIYVHRSLFKSFTHFFWYRIVAMPLAFLYTKLKLGHRIVNKEVLSPYKKQGYFLYGNHTQVVGDALIPNMINKAKDKYVIVHPNNVSIPYLGRVTPSLGALPLPGDMEAYRNFRSAIDERIKEGSAVVVYPEAHIWPYYTKIRPFGDVSFEYPARLGAPVFCFTNTYKKRALSKKPRVVTYVDGPFFPKEDASVREKRAQLRALVYNTMCFRAESSEVEYIKYVRKEPSDD